MWGSSGILQPHLGFKKNKNMAQPDGGKVEDVCIHLDTISQSDGLMYRNAASITALVTCNKNPIYVHTVWNLMGNTSENFFITIM